MRLPNVLLFLVLTILSSPSAGGEEYAWQRTDRYVAPDFEGFFPDSLEGGKRLDDLLTGKARRVPKHQYPEVLRQGLRRATKYRSQILDKFGQAYTLGIPCDEEFHELAWEIMYHATDSEFFRDDALYYGLHVAKDKPNNVLRALMQFGYQDRSRTIWGIKKYDNVEQVAAQLLALLDQHKHLSPKTILTTYDVYQGITGKSPPQPERFRDVGLFVMVVESANAKLDGSQSLAALRTRFDQELSLGDRLVDFTRRVHLENLHQVALIRGAPARDRLTEQLREHESYRLYSTHLLTSQSSDRLPELRRHLPEGTSLPPPAWKEQVALARQDFAWSRSESYKPPAFDQFFPDDAAGGLALDRLYAQRKESPLSDLEMLAIVRQGLRRTTVRPNSMLGWFCPRFLSWPQNPAAVEIVYHTLGADTGPTGNDSLLYGALYYGMPRLPEKPANFLRALPDVIFHAKRNARQTALYSLKSDREKQFVAELMLETLDNHAQLPPTQVIAAFDCYKRLTGTPPPQPERFAEIGRFVLVFGFEQDFSPEEVAQLVRVQLRPGKKLLKIDTLTDKNDPRRHSLLALIQGSAERDRMIQAFSDLKLDGIEIHAILPLNEEYGNMAAEAVSVPLVL